MVAVPSSSLPLALAVLILGVVNLPNISGQLNPSAVLQSLQGSFGVLRANAAAASAPSADNGVNVAAYSGSRVGPLFLFRSSAANAEIVNDGLKGLVVPHSLGLAFGDEFPKLRDDIIVQTRSGSGLRALTKFGNWKYNRENNKNEVTDPYIGGIRQLIGTFLPGGGGAPAADSGSGGSGFRVTVDDADS